MTAIPVAFIAITVSPQGSVGRWLSLGLFLVANVLLWGALLTGIFVNVDTDRESRDTHEFDTGEPSDAAKPGGQSHNENHPRGPVDP